MEQQQLQLLLLLLLQEVQLVRKHHKPVSRHY
jgi:hypothetical protein